MGQWPLVNYEVVGSVSVISLNRPERRNAFNHDLRMQFIDSLGHANADPATRSVVLTAVGDHFSSGGDLSGMDDRDLQSVRERMLLVTRLVRLIRGSAKPYVAAIEGVAFGAGFSLALACDQIVASQTAKFCSVFVKAGLFPDYGMTHLLPARAGDGVARRLMLSGDVMDANEALHERVIDKLVDAGGARAAAVELAERYAAVAPLPIAMMKAVWMEGRTKTLEGALAAEVDCQPSLFTTEDFSEVLEAFPAKRAPVFRGR